MMLMSQLSHFLFENKNRMFWVLMSQTVKNLLPGDQGSSPELGRSPEGGHGSPLSTVAWKIPWIEEPGELQPKGSHRVRHD